MTQTTTAGGLNIGDTVSINGRGKYTILGFEDHGKKYCDCCSKSGHYRLAYFNKGIPRHLVNEDHLQIYTGN